MERTILWSDLMLLALINSPLNGTFPFIWVQRGSALKRREFFENLAATNPPPGTTFSRKVSCFLKTQMQVYWVVLQSSWNAF